MAGFNALGGEIAYMHTEREGGTTMGTEAKKPKQETTRLTDMLLD